MLCTWLRRVVLGMALVVPARAETTYSFAIVPQFTPVEIGKRWTPLLNRLEADTGLAFQLRLHDKTPTFEADFLRGVPDFVYLNPYHMVMAAKARGYVPLVRGAEPLAGILVADKAGPVGKLADLNGARIAFPSPNAFGASLYMRALLAEREGIDFTPVYVGTHRNAYRHVLLGEEAAGGRDRGHPGAGTRLGAGPAPRPLQDAGNGFPSRRRASPGAPRGQGSGRPGAARPEPGARRQETAGRRGIGRRHGSRFRP